MRKAWLAIATSLTLAVVGCSKAESRHGGGPTTGPSGGGGNSGGTGGNQGGPAGGPPCSQSGTGDNDGDGYTVAQGDCNDCDASINPGAIDIPGNGQDDDCNGSVDDPQAACDSAATGKNDAASIAQSIELCDSRFLKNSAFGTVSSDKARNVLTTFGVLAPHQGANMALLSTGLAVDENGPGFVSLQDPGTEFGTMGTNPLPNLKGASSCTQDPTTKIWDYTEVIYTLKAPTNVNSFSFDFQFFSAEYPEYVCQGFNDEFLAAVQSSKTYPTLTNISFDSGNNPITVNSGFFTVCQNGTTSQTEHCTSPVSDIDGTGYEQSGGLLDPEPVGGSTGWLTTTAPIAPGEDITLHFIIFDSGDDEWDSSVLLDNFKWGATTVTGPVTNPITYRKVRHHAGAALTCHA